MQHFFLTIVLYLHRVNILIEAADCIYAWQDMGPKAIMFLV